jgi:hypothetical protein
VINVREADLQGLRARLRRTRWPTPWPGAGWETGTNATDMARLVEYWVSGYEWRVHEADVNALPWHTSAVEGTDVR